MPDPDSSLGLAAYVPPHVPDSPNPKYHSPGVLHWELNMILTMSHAWKFCARDSVLVNHNPGSNLRTQSLVWCQALALSFASDYYLHNQLWVLTPGAILESDC